MAHMLLAVLVPATATADTVDTDLDRITEPRVKTLDIDVPPRLRRSFADPAAVCRSLDRSCRRTPAELTDWLAAVADSHR